MTIRKSMDFSRVALSPSLSGSALPPCSFFDGDVISLITSHRSFATQRPQIRPLAFRVPIAVHLFAFSTKLTANQKHFVRQSSAIRTFIDIIRCADGRQRESATATSDYWRNWIFTTLALSVRHGPALNRFEVRSCRNYCLPGRGGSAHYLHQAYLRWRGQKYVAYPNIRAGRPRP